MSKGEPVLRILDEQLRRDQLLHDRKQLTLVDSQNRAQQRKVKPAARDRRHLKGVSRRFAEAMHPTLNRIPYGARNADPTRLHPVRRRNKGRTHQLLDKKWVSFRQLDDGLHGA